MYKIKIEKDGIALAWTGSESLEQITEWLKGDIHRHPDDALIIISKHSYEHDLAKCIENRKSEYPKPEDFMDAWFDGGAEKLNQMEVIRLSIKAKYPKPEFSEQEIVEQKTVKEKKEEFFPESLPDFHD